MKIPKMAALLFTLGCAVAHATLDDEKLIGTYALDCKNIAKGAVILTLIDARLVMGERITKFVELTDETRDYFGKYDKRDYQAAIALSRAGDTYLEVFKIKQGRILKTVGSNDVLLPLGLVFNSGQNTFRKC